MSLGSTLTNIFTMGGSSQLNAAAAQANPLGTAQQQAYGSQLTQLLASPTGYSSTPLANAEKTGVSDIFTKAGVSSNLAAMMTPYLSQLQATSFSDYIKDLIDVSGAGAGGAQAGAQYQIGQAALDSQEAQQIGGFVGNLFRMSGAAPGNHFGGGGGGSFGSGGYGSTGYTDAGAGYLG